MHLRRPIAGLAVIALSALGLAALPASAGLLQPTDMVATPSTGPVGQSVTIHNASNSPCGGQQGDGPAEVALTVTKPDHTSVFHVTVPADASGNWTTTYTTTDQVGTYRVTGFCQDQQLSRITGATDFSYTDTTFDITAQVTTTITSTTVAPSTTTSTVPPAAVAPQTQAQATFTG